MTKDECFYLGKIVKPFSYKGELVVFFDVDDVQKYENLDSLYIEINKRLVEYTISSIRYHGNKFVVKFNDVTAEESEALVGKDLYLPLSMLPPLTGNQFYFHEVIGFEVADKEKGNIGHITDIIDNTTQPIMFIDHGGKEILIPLVDDIIKSVDREKRIINIQAPDGLIDIYL
ncbi:MAG: 16S rRNA processing protein RimM [Bacteroidales bacterium]|nr:16S rRNA processing protein RimM [Bacteroidales bacterium]